MQRCTRGSFRAGALRGTPLSLPLWEKLQRLAEEAAPAGSRPVTASKLATAILEQVLATAPPE